ncbi:MAG: hypothetical protein PVJ80_08990 [Gemmatimonadota bacterium]|jgi:hypothetical protein
MIRRGAAVLGVVVLAGCAYYNTLYNSERLFEEAEAHRRAGRDSLAGALYRDVIRKTSDAYRPGRTGEEAAETLALLGRAQLRAGQAREARAALLEAATLTARPELRSTILVHLAFASARLGDEEEALARVEDALRGALAGEALGEAYLLRGRLRLQEAETPAAWEDLELASAADPLVSVDAGVERLRWGVHYRAFDRAESAVDELLVDPRAGERHDTIAALVSAAATRWGPATAAALLDDVDSSPWDRMDRSTLQLEHAGLLLQAGETEQAEEEAWRVARGRGESVTEARLLLADWQLGRARDLSDAQAVVPILLPVADDPRAAELVDAVDDLDRYSSIGLDDPLGWFAAAEVARNRLGAPTLARGLYLAYADTDPTDPWASKALLAALSVSSDEEDRTWMRGRLEAHGDSPYVQAARGGSTAGLEALEEELQERLREIASR